MTKKLILFLFAIPAFFSCGKDSIDSKPGLTLVSISSEIVPPFSALEIRLRLTDKEGDFHDTIWVRKITTRCPGSNFADSGKFRIPASVPPTNNFDGEVAITFDYASELAPRCTRPDTAVFSFWMKDRRGRLSDTVRTQPIIILRP